MQTADRTGLIVGVLLLCQMVIGYSENFVLLQPVFNPPGFLENAAANPSTMALAALFGLVSGLISVGIAVTAFRGFWQSSEVLALWFIALAIVCLAVNVGESVSVMSLLSLSESYAKAMGAQRDLFPMLRGMVSSARNWAHYFGLIVSGSYLLVFYVAMLRLHVLPRVLAAFGVAAVLLQLTAVSMPLFGHDVIFPMLAPLGLVQLTAAGWMLVKGWRPPVRTESTLT